MDSNYCATVVRVRNLVTLANCDNIVGFPILGMQAIVGNNTKEGELGVLFPTEVQLSHEYVRFNNLYHNSKLNKDENSKGYLGDNRRIRAIKLRGHRSDAMFMPMESLAYTGVRLDTLKEGMQFDCLNKYDICCKYELPTPQLTPSRTSSRKLRTSHINLPEQERILQLFREVDNLDRETRVVVTQKLHGTNVRIGNVLVKRSLTWLERLAKRLGIEVNDSKYQMVYGDHHSIKDPNNIVRSFYEEDFYSIEGRKLDGLLPNGYVVYGEIVGYASYSTPIQKHYTYTCLPGGRSLYVYRVAIANPQGGVTDLSWDAVRDFCDKIGVSHVPELMRIRLQSFIEVADFLLDINYAEHGEFRDVPVPLSIDSPCDEGMCIRIEGLEPKIFKVKSPLFLEHETRMLDEGQ